MTGSARGAATGGQQLDRGRRARRTRRKPAHARWRIGRSRQRVPAPSSSPWWRYAALAGVAVAVLGTGLAFGFGDFFGQRGTPSVPEAVSVRMSMAGFEPRIIHATAGERLTLEMWTTDSAPHLDRGVHTLISDELGIYEELRAQSRRIVTLKMPSTPGDYDIYCDTCCGGRLSPAMHGVLRVEG
jgi:cytochrome c oxidase subunit II